MRLHKPDTPKQMTKRTHPEFMRLLKGKAGSACAAWYPACALGFTPSQPFTIIAGDGWMVRSV